MSLRRILTPCLIFTILTLTSPVSQVWAQDQPWTGIFDLKCPASVSVDSQFSIAFTVRWNGAMTGDILLTELREGSNLVASKSYMPISTFGASNGQFVSTASVGMHTYTLSASLVDKNMKTRPESVSQQSFQIEVTSYALVTVTTSTGITSTTPTPSPTATQTVVSTTTQTVVSTTTQTVVSTTTQTVVSTTTQSTTQTSSTPKVPILIPAQPAPIGGILIPLVIIIIALAVGFIAFYSKRRKKPAPPMPVQPVTPILPSTPVQFVTPPRAETAVQTPPVAQPGPAPTKFCRLCGTKIPPDSTLCEQCRDLMGRWVHEKWSE